MYRKKIVEDVVKFFIETDLIELGATNLAHIAQRFGVTQSHLSRCFKKTTDLGFNKYFMRIKLLKCALLIHQDPSLSIKEISTISGFSDREHFNKVFKKHFGKAPTVFSPFNK